MKTEIENNKEFYIYLQIKEDNVIKTVNIFDSCSNAQSLWYPRCDQETPVTRKACACSCFS